MLISSFIVFVFFFVCEVYCECHFGSRPQYSTFFKCESLNDVLQIRNKALVEHLIVYNVTDLRVCDFPLFEGFENLDHIEMESGLLTKITEKCFKGASNLTTIIVMNQELTEFDLDESIRKNLNRLELDGNQLKGFNFEGKIFPKLRHLSLNRNDLTNFSVNSDQAPNLWSIDLFENKIEDLNIEAEQLIYFMFIDNRIETLEEDEFQAPEIISMHFSLNNLTAISSKILSKFPKLQSASFKNNPIHSIDFISMNITSLNCYSEEIILEAENSVKEISFVILWDSIRSLNFSNNKIRRMTLFNMKFELKIEELILSDNLIDKINRNDLQLLKDLIVIDLSYNKISSIDENAFLNNPNLHTLLLKGNNLQSISLSTLEPLKSIVFIDFSINKLANFAVPNFNESSQQYHPVFSVHRILLEGNPILCSNQNILYRWMTTLNKFVIEFEFFKKCK